MLQHPERPEVQFVPPGHTPDERLCVIRLLRTVLFRPIEDHERKRCDFETLAETADGIFGFSGEELNHEDLEVWDAIMRRTDDVPWESDYAAGFTGPELLSQLRIMVNEQNLESLYRSIRRLRRGQLWLTVGGKAEELLPLLKHVHYYAPTLTWVACVSDTIRDSHMDFARHQRPGHRRQGLRDNPLASWLYNYFTLYQDTNKIDLQTVKTLTGCGGAEDEPFREAVSEAATDLTRLGRGTMQGAVFRSGDTLRIIREQIPSQSQ